VIVIIHQTRST